MTEPLGQYGVSITGSYNTAPAWLICPRCGARTFHYWASKYSHGCPKCAEGEHTPRGQSEA